MDTTSTTTCNPLVIIPVLRKSVWCSTRCHHRHSSFQGSSKSRSTSSSRQAGRMALPKATGQLSRRRSLLCLPQMPPELSASRQLAITCDERVLLDSLHMNCLCSRKILGRSFIQLVRGCGPQNVYLFLWKIRQGLDVRTTLMLQELLSRIGEAIRKS